MGVKGLTSYVRQYQRAIAEQVDLESDKDKTAASNAKTPFVVDGWAYIFHSFLTGREGGGDSINGSSYPHFQQGLSEKLRCWSDFGLEVIFVFDGPFLPLKLRTTLERQTSISSCNSAFMRSSPSSRRNARFQSQMGLIPPLLFYSTLDVLRAKGVQFVIAENEADGLVAEIAERRGGWAVSNDSDFFILCSKGNKGRGYVPLDGIEYLVKVKKVEEERVNPASAFTQELDSNQGASLDDGFEEVGRKGKPKRKNNNKVSDPTPLPLADVMILSNPPLPNEEGTQVQGVRFQSYSSFKLAALLQLPPSLLPLLAALVGNDYTTPLQASILSRNLPSGHERVSSVAAVLRSECNKLVQGASNEGGRSGWKEPMRGGGQNNKASQLRGGGGLEVDRKKPLASVILGNESANSSATATPTRSSSKNPGISASESLVWSQVPQDPVRDMVESVVDRILSLPEHTTSSNAKGASVVGKAVAGLAYVASGERDQVVESIIDSVCTYSLLTVASAGSAHLFSPASSFFDQDRFGSPWTARRVCREELPRRGRHFKMEDRLRGRKRYQRAYRRGDLYKSLVEGLCHRVFIVRQFVEDPDTKSIHLGPLRELRSWIWALLFQVWGMEWARESMEEPEIQEGSGGDGEEGGSDDGKEAATGSDLLGGRKVLGKEVMEEGEDPDELVDVVTPPSSVSGTLEGPESSQSETSFSRDFDDQDLPSRPGSVDEEEEEEEEKEEDKVKPPPAVLEYARKGDRLVGEFVEIVKLEHLLLGDPTLEAEVGSAGRRGLPVGLRKLFKTRPNQVGEEKEEREEEGETLTIDHDMETRLELYLHIHRTSIADLRAKGLPKGFWPLVACLRYLVLKESERLGESTKKSNWSREELKSAIKAAVSCRKNRMRVTTSKSEKEGQRSWIDPVTKVPDPNGPSTRSIHLSTMVQLTLETGWHLAQALLLFEREEKEEEDEERKEQIGQDWRDDELGPPHSLHDPCVFHLELWKSTSRRHQPVDQEEDDGGTRQEGEGEEDQILGQRILECVLGEGEEEGIEELLSIDIETARKKRKLVAKKERRRRRKEEEEEEEERERGEKVSEVKDRPAAAGVGGRYAFLEMEIQSSDGEDAGDHEDV
ncbi:hypothetical protein IE53DRAFT_384992 [Violaceomyces palustris]|uniref:Uncharacterized protein n=1 Tax=Violaceomyces palustris TaxID=1673888 RepID=A0ACD0P3C0_9BASI|nr:hypothetical protein IE53DRAFT_384992 [Violaceomyces palustris]